MTERTDLDQLREQLDALSRAAFVPAPVCKERIRPAVSPEGGEAGESTGEHRTPQDQERHAVDAAAPPIGRPGLLARHNLRPVEVIAWAVFSVLTVLWSLLLVVGYLHFAGEIQ